jgi:hypothetical protein
MENHEGINLFAASLRKGCWRVKLCVCDFDMSPQLETSRAPPTRILSFPSGNRQSAERINLRAR